MAIDIESLKYPQDWIRFGLLAKKETTDGSFVYTAYALPGTNEGSAHWQAKCVEDDGTDEVTTWADGNAMFDNEATDLTGLSYS